MPGKTKKERLEALFLFLIRVPAGNFNTAGRLFILRCSFPCI